MIFWGSKKFKRYPSTISHHKVPKNMEKKKIQQNKIKYPVRLTLYVLRNDTQVLRTIPPQIPFIQGEALLLPQKKVIEKAKQKG